ncbi:MAG TPA: hypothetical protein VJ767_11125 [Nitrososphaeraceae archaeon]|nr:hypothetical protein [Nitrososphaeraceae archaeon]
MTNQSQNEQIPSKSFTSEAEYYRSNKNKRNKILNRGTKLKSQENRMVPPRYFDGVEHYQKKPVMQ